MSLNRRDFIKANAAAAAAASAGVSLAAPKAAPAAAKPVDNTLRWDKGALPFLRHRLRQCWSAYKAGASWQRKVTRTRK